MADDKSGKTNGKSADNLFRVLVLNEKDYSPDTFKPSPRQESFLQIAQACCESGDPFRPVWIKQCLSSPDFSDKPMRLSEFHQWSEDPHFVAWFYDGLPQNEEPDEFELSMMDAQFWNGMQGNMKKDREWAYKLYAKIRYSDRKSAVDKDSKAELDNFFGEEKDSDAWRQSVPEA